MYGKSTQKETVRIAHFSVQEYLESERIKHQKAAMFSLTAVTAHAEIAQICLIYLLEPGLTFTEEDEYPLANFAAAFWYQHYKNAEHLDIQLDNLILKLFQYPKGLFSAIMELRRPVSQPDFEDQIETSSCPVYYASFLGLWRVLEEIISREQQKNSAAYILPPASTSKSSDVNFEGGYFGHPLQAASAQGHEKVVQLLVEKGADVNAQCGEYGNALQAASSCGHKGIVQLLV